MNQIHIAMPFADVFGAGTCGKYLIAEFSKRGQVCFDYVPGDDVSPSVERPAGAVYKPLVADIACPLLQFSGPQLEQQTKYRGHPNVAYIFSEWAEISDEQKRNLRKFDVLIAGSTWNANVIRNAGFECASVPQGVDTAVFRPLEVRRDEKHFVIYSGGKWEHRKAQDIVVKAVKVMQQRHADVRLVASWQNLWSNTDGSEHARSAGIKFSRYPILRQDALCRLMNTTDVGLFPNRCEGGTNLVLMDYLACGKPVVASVATGQKDVLDPSYSMALRGGDDAVLEAAIYGLEWLYQHRDEMRRMGALAAQAMTKFPWSRTADGISAAIDAVVPEAVAA